METGSRWRIAAFVLALSTCFLSSRAQAQCVGDIVRDGRVDGGDLGVMLAYWGPRTASAFSLASDLNQDGQIDGVDLGLLLAGWGICSDPFSPGWATLIEPWPDPVVVTDPALRTAIVATGLAWRVRDTVTQIEMLLVPPGTFQMGCVMGTNQHGCDSSELPVHTVTLTQPFYLGRYEVMQSQWQARMGSNPSYFAGYSDSPSRPVEQVSWNTIHGFCSSTGMRLPTEAEWEYACRAGTQTPFYNGSTEDGTVGNLAWYSANSGSQSRPVGGKAANALGFHDMLGNVWEWVNDWADVYTANAQTDPTGPVGGSSRAFRGGSWYDGTFDVRSSYRYYLTPGGAFSGLGFRVARTP